MLEPALRAVGFGRYSAWMGANGYRAAGPARELYLKIGQPVRQDDESYVTEIQMPVEKC